MVPPATEPMPEVFKIPVGWLLLPLPLMATVSIASASGGAHSDLGKSADCARAGRLRRKVLRFFDEETPSSTGFQ